MPFAGVFGPNSRVCHPTLTGTRTPPPLLSTLASCPPKGPASLSASSWRSAVPPAAAGGADRSVTGAGSQSAPLRA